MTLSLFIGCQISLITDSQDFFEGILSYLDSECIHLTRPFKNWSPVQSSCVISGSSIRSFYFKQLRCGVSAMSQHDEFFHLLQKLGEQQREQHASSHRPPSSHLIAGRSPVILPAPREFVSTAYSTPSQGIDVLKKMISVNNESQSLVGPNRNERNSGVINFPRVPAPSEVADASTLLRILQKSSQQPHARSDPVTSASDTVGGGSLAYQCDDQHQLNVSRFLKRTGKSTSTDATKVNSSGSYHEMAPAHVLSHYSHHVQSNDTNQRQQRRGPRRRYSSSGDGHGPRGQFGVPISGTGSSSEEVDEVDSGMYFGYSDASDNAAVIYPPPDHRQRRRKDFISVKHPSHTQANPPLNNTNNRTRSVTHGKPPDWDDFDIAKDFDFDANLKEFDKEAFCQPDGPSGSQQKNSMSARDSEMNLRLLLGIKNTSATQVVIGACPSKDYRPTGSTVPISLAPSDPAIVFSAAPTTKQKDTLMTVSTPSTEEEQEYTDYDADEAGRDLPTRKKAPPTSKDTGDALLQSAAQFLSSLTLEMDEKKSTSVRKPTVFQEEEEEEEVPMAPSDFMSALPVTTNKSSGNQLLTRQEESSVSSTATSVSTTDDVWFVANKPLLHVPGKVSLEERNLWLDEKLTGSSGMAAAALASQDVMSALPCAEMIQLASHDVAHYFMRLVARHNLQISTSRPVVLMLDSGNMCSVICLRALYHFLVTFCRSRPDLLGTATKGGPLAYVRPFPTGNPESQTSSRNLLISRMYQAQIHKLADLQRAGVVNTECRALPPECHASLLVFLPPQCLPSSTVLMTNWEPVTSDVLLCVDFPLHVSTQVPHLSQYYRAANRLACLLLGYATCLPWEWRTFLMALSGKKDVSSSRALDVALVELVDLGVDSKVMTYTTDRTHVITAYAKLFFSTGSSLLELMDTGREE